jgi:hypothetical protein
MKCSLRSSRFFGAVGALGVVALLSACGNLGADRTLGITATGVVNGFVYFDANGSGTFDAADVPFVGARVRLVTPIARDTVLRVTTGADGTFRASGVPVGTYAVVLDAASVGDSVAVTGVGGVVTILPNDSVSVAGAAGYPTRSISQVRSGTLGARVFVSGVALHGLATYSDTLLHIADTSGSLRAVRVRPSAVAAGDSVRLRGRIAERAGQRVLDDVTVFVLGAALIPAAPTVTTAAANTAATGALDATLVRILDAAITDTATVSGSLTLTVTDGSGALTVLLDRAADASFRPPFVAGRWDAGQRFDLIGVLVPSGPGAWALRPRTAFDLIPR